MRAVITGVAGVIGSSLAERLVADGNQVVGIDNLSGGKLEHLNAILKKSNFTFHKDDIFNKKLLDRALKDCDIVFHFAAKSDIKTIGKEDFEQNAVATYQVLEAMRENKVGRLVFSSSSAVYGEPKVIPTPESYGPMEPISLYGASKLASEALISAYSHLYSVQSWIFRFANVVCGKSRKRGTTVVTDFIAKLTTNPKRLEILGNGKQKKSYLYVDDCIEGVLHIQKTSKEKINVFNLGTNQSVTVDDIAQIVISSLKLKDVKIEHTRSKRGWPGDVTLMLLDSSKAQHLGWHPRFTSTQALTKSIVELISANLPLN